MRKQSLTLRRNTPITIETPEGLLRITLVDRKKVEIELPTAMRAYVGDPRALENARFLAIDDTGKLTPTYDLLVPILGDDGELMGVEPRKARRIDPAAPQRSSPIRLVGAL